MPDPDAASPSILPCNFIALVHSAVSSALLRHGGCTRDELARVDVKPGEHSGLHPVFATVTCGGQELLRVGCPSELDHLAQHPLDALFLGRRLRSVLGNLEQEENKR